MSISRRSLQRPTPQPPITALSSAPEASCTRCRLVRSVLVLFLVRRDRGAGANRRTGKLGIGPGLVGTVAEPDIADDHGIAGYDVAFARGAIADHPEQAVGEAHRARCEQQYTCKDQTLHGRAPAMQVGLRALQQYPRERRTCDR